MNVIAAATEVTAMRLVEHKGHIWIVERTIRSGEVVERDVRRRDYPHQLAPEEVARVVFSVAFPTARPDRWWDRD